MREKKDASYLLRVLMMCEMDDACCHARERGRWRVDKPEKRDWIFGSKFSLAAVIISSFHLHRRGFFFPVLM